MSDERDEVHECGCYETEVGGGWIWFACAAHGGGCGSQFKRTQPNEEQDEQVQLGGAS